MDALMIAVLSMQRWSFWAGVIVLQTCASAIALSPNPFPSDPYEWQQQSSSDESPQERTRNRGESGKLYRHRVSPNWIDATDKFWYRNDLAGGAREFILVDAGNGQRTPAFDHEAVASALGNGARSTHLPIERLEYQATEQAWILIGTEKVHRWDPQAMKLKEVERTAEATQVDTTKPTERRGRVAGDESSVTFENRTQSVVEIFWLSGDGGRQSYGKIEAGGSKDQHTFGGHRWQIVTAQGAILGEIEAEDQHSVVAIDGRPMRPKRNNRRRRTQDDQDRQWNSPDDAWRATVEDHNIVLYRSGATDRVVLSRDGSEAERYTQLSWSPDSQTIVAFRERQVEKLPVHLIRSSPSGGGRAQLESRPYVLPGDPFPTYELNLFRIASGEQIKPQVDRFEHEWLSPRIRFSKDGKTFTYDQTDRGHGRYRLFEVNVQDGSVRSIIDQRSTTFIWTAHTENQELPIVQWLNDSQELLFATEKYGWRQLILIDAATGAELRELTPRGLVLRGVELVDEGRRMVWFSASGREGQDPYLVHHGYVEMDSGKLTWLTEGHGHHSLQFSPQRDYVIDTYSRVDLPPITELRRVNDGSKVCDLEVADISELQAEGWTPPEVFSAKGRDGQTDIWGIICRPKDFDHTKKYPVIEDIYAGPQGSFVPKTFSPVQRYESLTRLGFIVVKIDGMGTANRSKAFHDVCWKNLKDGGFPDRILWMQAAAAKYAELDLSRVGIYGTSAGGQNAAAAVLFHPEFYKVAVAACGCHDNRMDKASWNEQWMGYPVGPHYAECSNIDNAARLQGKLFLIVGEMDNNVPPESTLRLADALIRADKDFDLLVVPNGGHGMGGAYGQRRMHDFFVRHLGMANQ